MFILLLFFYFIQTSCFEITILPNSNLEQVQKIRNFLDKVHSLDWEYSNRSISLTIELIDTTSEWEKIITDNKLPSQAIAIYNEGEMKIYLSKKGRDYCSLLHEYFHFMSHIGFNTSVLFQIQESITNDYSTYMSDRYSYYYWTSNFKEFSAYMFTIWFNTLYGLMIDQKKILVYKEDKVSLMAELSPRLMDYLLLIYKKQDICNFIENDFPWCNGDNLGLFLLSNSYSYIITNATLALLCSFNLLLFSCNKYFISSKRFIAASLTLIAISIIPVVLQSFEIIRLREYFIYNCFVIGLNMGIFVPLIFKIMASNTIDEDKQTL